MRRRFIAGVVCPSCGQMDSTVMEKTEELMRRICVNCGHVEEQALDEPGANVPHLKTRVTELKVEDAPKNDLIPAMNLAVESPASAAENAISKKNRC